MSVEQRIYQGYVVVARRLDDLSMFAMGGGSVGGVNEERAAVGVGLVPGDVDDAQQLGGVRGGEKREVEGAIEADEFIDPVAAVGLLHGFDEFIHVVEGALVERDEGLFYCERFEGRADAAKLDQLFPAELGDVEAAVRVVHEQALRLQGLERLSHGDDAGAQIGRTSLQNFFARLQGRPLWISRRSSSSTACWVLVGRW